MTCELSFDMIDLRQFATVILLLSIPLAVLIAQEDAVVNVTFRTYSVDGDIEGLSCLTTKGAVAVDVSGRRRSEPIHYRGTGQLVFFQPTEQIEGEPIKPLAVVTLSDAVRNPLLIFVRMHSSVDRSQIAAGNPYRIIVIHDDPLEFKDGGMKFINLTPQSIVMVAGQNDEFKASLEPGGVASHQLDAEFKGNIPIKIATKSYDGWDLLINSRVFPSIQARDIYFISPIPNRSKGHQVRISTLRERGDNAKIRLKPSL